MEPAEFWSTGDYGVVGDLWSQPGRDVAATVPVNGRDVIDLATGTGTTAIAAAQRGARSVVGVDITPTLLQEAALRADKAGVRVHWLEADMASVHLPSASADVVTSTFGIIFAADPAAAFAEARRLTRPDGRIVFTSWSATGLFARIRQTLAVYFPEVPEPWHEDPAGIRAVVGDDVEVTTSTFELTVASPEQFVNLLEQHSAPIILGARTLGDQWHAARQQLLTIITEAGKADDHTFRVPVEYLVTTIDMRRAP